MEWLFFDDVAPFTLALLLMFGLGFIARKKPTTSPRLIASNTREKPTHFNFSLALAAKFAK
jgi:hypothetical protein